MTTRAMIEDCARTALLASIGAQPVEIVDQLSQSVAGRKLAYFAKCNTSSTSYSSRVSPLIGMVVEPPGVESSNRVMPL